MSRPCRIVVVGAGGQARDTAWLIRQINAGSERLLYDYLGFVVTDLSKLGPNDSEVLGDHTWIEAHRGDIDAVALGIGTPRARLSVAAMLMERFPDLEWPTLVHPRVEFDPASATLGRGIMIGAGVVGSVNLVLEDFCLVNLGVTLGHEAELGCGVVVNHNASIAGGVRLERGVLVGSSASVLQYLRIGEGATIGAGAVVTRDVPSGETWVGVPARPMKPRGPVGRGGD